MTWLAALNEAWDELAAVPPVARAYRSRLLPTDMPIDVSAAMRAADEAPCLMLKAASATQVLFELGGMKLDTVPDASGTFLVLSLEDSSRRDLFATICADVLLAAEQAEKAKALAEFLARLDAWRQFLRDRRDGLSRSETIGLIGELIVLEEILASDPRDLATWESPNDGLHDFLKGGHALEAKTSLGPAPGISISRLDQLDSAGLRRLDLLHVKLIEAPDGRSLRGIAGAITVALPDEASRRAFENALLRRGLMPDDDAARAAPRVRLRSIDAYGVTDGFPRILRTMLPTAITDATYTLEVRGIGAFAVDVTQTVAAFVHGGADV